MDRNLLDAVLSTDTQSAARKLGGESDQAIADLLIDRAERRTKEPAGESLDDAAPLGRRMLGRLRRSLG